MRNLRMVTLVLVVLGLSAGPAVGAEPVGVGSDRVTYYLALGDSLAAGYQPIGREEDDRKTRMGYADQLWLMARHAYPDLQLVNLGCPGANTQTITEIDPRCQYENGSQLDEALAIIKEHQQELAFITIDIGFNDFECEDMSCLFPGIDGIAERLPPILATLQEAA
ncbi:MAG: SGNH/GDSL hydrolase family protein, partial [Chloroflexota bacterium]